MTTALLPLPARRPGALTAPHHDLRPCVTHPPQWWDTGNENNPEAIKRCGTCPWREQCTPADGRDAAGTIRAGIAYDDHGKPAPICTTCGTPSADTSSSPRCINGHGGTIADHHDTIARMLDGGARMRDVAATIGYSHNSVSRYWRQYLNSTGQRPTRIERLPGVPDGCTTNRARDWHDQVIAMLSDLKAAYTYEEVAYAIGSTRDSVKSHWQRYQEKQVAAGMPAPPRRPVANRASQRITRVAA